MKTSILISTYNGEAFVEEQLASLLEQTVQPDEVLIVDDCSTDGTYAKIQAFLAKNRLGGWKLSQNEHNRGFRANFRALAEAATGDLVFFMIRTTFGEVAKSRRASTLWLAARTSACCVPSTSARATGLRRIH